MMDIKGAFRFHGRAQTGRRFSAIMKRALLSLTAAAALAVTQAVAVTPQVEAASPAPAQVLPSVLSHMEQAAKSLSTLQAGISQLKRDTTLDYTENSVGTLLYKKGAPGQERVLLQYTKPNQTISVIGDKVVVFQPQINQAFETTRNAAAGKNKSLGFLGLGYGQAAAQLREKYVVTPVGDEVINGKKTTLIDLRPRVPENGIVRVQVWVDNATWLPVQYLLKEKGAETTVSLSAMKPNVSLDDSRFEIKLPGNVQIVKG